MKVLKQTAGFMTFALALQALWILLRVDILEDLNLFADVRYWPWFAGSVLLFALLASLLARIRRPVLRNGLVFGMLGAFLGIGLLVPRWLGGDGLAVGMLQFLKGYWILMGGAYLLAFCRPGRAGEAGNKRSC